MSDPDSTIDWYFDLKRKIAVPASERGPGDQVMGPYRTKVEAENWKSTVESRNDAWDDDDKRWDRPDLDESQ